MHETFFVCDECDCLDSTTEGTFRSKATLPKQYASKNLCCACAPVYDVNGRPIAGHGRWHDRFDRKKVTVQWLLKNWATVVYFGRFSVDVVLAMDARKLSPCPNCGSSEVAVARSAHYGAVICLQCGMAGARSDTISGATKEWNNGVG